MWIFSRYGFYSVSSQGKNFAIRSRMKGHLEALIKRCQGLHGATIIETPLADYHFRILVSRGAWEKIVGELVEEQTWGNFKSEVARFQGRDAYERALHDVWSTMHNLQWDAVGKVGKRWR